MLEPAVVARIEPGEMLVGHFALRHPERLLEAHEAQRAFVGGAVFVGIAWLSYRNLESGFVPQMDEGAFILDYWAPAGASWNT